MIQIMHREEQDRLFHRYAKNDLFCHWTPILIQLEIEQNELDVCTLWYHMEKVLEKLRIEDGRRDVLIYYLYKQLLDDFKVVRQENGSTVTRTDLLAEQSAVTIMCVVLTELLNAFLPGYACEENKNFPICVAIANIMRNHPRFQMLMGRFFMKKKDNWGKEVVITPADPMKMDYVEEQWDDDFIKEMDDMVENLRMLTVGLKQPFGEHWDDWCKFCHEVCHNQEFLSLLYKVEPKRNEWGINQKMVCNMVGLFNQEMKINHPINALNILLSSKQLRSYISNHADYKSSDTVLTKYQHDIMKRILIKRL